ncbi:MAG: hypothetical protein K2Q18_01380, partial [Bdellovibrionales bacterium]|nr:hypothetical protein [Bdellovibrionales bacterium]
LYSIYPNGDSTKGSIQGKVIGGSSLTGIFGAHVEAISLKNGRIAAAAISEPNGTFSIDGLSKNDQYYLYSSPVVQVGLPSRYNVAKSDFCNSSLKYRGSFFQGCGSSDEGYPQTVSLNSSAVDVGKITVRCGFDVPVAYMSKKTDSINTFDIQDGVNSGVGNSFTGYFSTLELAQTSPVDHFKIPYSQFSTADWAALSSSGDLYVELKIINQALYSPFKVNAEITSSSGTIYGVVKYSTEADGWLNLESTFHLPINRGNPSDNDFNVTITPEKMEGFSFPTGLPYTKADYFPSSDSFSDSLRFYLVSASIVKSNGNGTYSFVSHKNKQFTDNSTCPDATNTYALSNFSVKGGSGSTKKKSDGIACGTVDLEGGPGNGPGGFFIGLILSLILCHLTSSIIKQRKTILLRSLN